MKHYTDTIPVSLAEKLKEKGMPMEGWQGWATPYISVIENSEYEWLDKEFGKEVSKVEKRYAVPSYAEVFDWLMEEKNIHINICRFHPFWEAVIIRWDANLKREEKIEYEEGRTWHEAAEKAIEKALTLI